MKKTLILMCGIPASGKSTTAERLANHFDHPPIISLDAIRENLFGTRAIQKQGYIIYKKSIIDTVISFKNHDVVIYDATNRTAKARKRVVEQIQKNIKCDVFCIYLATDRATAIERNKTRDENIRVPEEVIEKMLNNLQEPSIAEEYFKDIYKIYPETLDNTKFIVYDILTKQILED